MGAISALFWGLLVLSALVFVHEGGHFLAARAFGVRVTEFFLGMPSRFKISRKSKKRGTEFGVTPLLLGGYNRICGMDGDEDPRLSAVLACVQRHGRVSAETVAAELGCEVEEAYALLATLSDWASIRPFYDPEKGEYPNQKVYPECFETLARDANMLTEYDPGHDFDAPGATKAGEPHVAAALTSDELLAAERSHTYLGCGFLKRIAMLLAGPLVNLIVAFAIVVVFYMVVGVSYVVDTNVIGDIAHGSYAEAAGIAPGDAITMIDGTPTSTWTEIIEALDPVLKKDGSFEVSYLHEGAEKSATVTIERGGADVMFGITATTDVYRADFFEASRAAIGYAAAVGGAALSLINPSQTMEVLNQSSSVVGISVMAAEAAESGISDLMLFVAAISMSLGFMNLLPIPPLDGGKILIEVIQLVSRRQLSKRAQTIVSYVGLVFFLFVFLFVLRNDILRMMG